MSDSACMRVPDLRLTGKLSWRLPVSKQDGARRHRRHGRRREVSFRAVGAPRARNRRPVGPRGAKGRARRQRADTQPARPAGAKETHARPAFDLYALAVRHFRILLSCCRPCGSDTLARPHAQAHTAAAFRASASGSQSPGTGSITSHAQPRRAISAASGAVRPAPGRTGRQGSGHFGRRRSPGSQRMARSQSSRVACGRQLSLDDVRPAASA